MAVPGPQPPNPQYQVFLDHLLGMLQAHFNPGPGGPPDVTRKDARQYLQQSGYKQMEGGTPGAVNDLLNIARQDYLNGMRPPITPDAMLRGFGPSPSMPPLGGPGGFGPPPTRFPGGFPGPLGPPVAQMPYFPGLTPNTVGQMPYGNVPPPMASPLGGMLGHPGLGVMRTLPAVV